MLDQAPRGVVWGFAKCYVAMARELNLLHAIASYANGQFVDSVVLGH